jgi:hypothetical protein
MRKEKKKEDDENIHGFIDELPSRGGTDDGIHTLVDCSNLTKLIPKGSDEFTTASDPVTMNVFIVFLLLLFSHKKTISYLL